MSRAAALSLVALALLSACRKSEAPQVTESGNASATDYVSRVEALSPKQRDAVLFRAIRDAGQDCQQVTDSVRTGTADGRPAWIATCDGRTRWTVVLSDTGVATIAAVPAGG